MTLWACNQCGTVRETASKPSECKACGFSDKDTGYNGPPTVYRRVEL